MAAGAAILDLDALAGLDDARLQAIELLQGVACPVEAVDRRIERIDVGPRRHLLHAIGPELQGAVERRAGHGIVEAAAEVEIAADQPVKPACLAQHQSEISDIEGHAAALAGRLHAEGGTLAGRHGELGRGEPVACHLESAIQRAERAALHQHLLDLHADAARLVRRRRRSAGRGVGKVVTALKRLADLGELVHDSALKATRHREPAATAGGLITVQAQLVADLGAGGELHGDIEQAVGAGVLGPFEWREGCLGGLEVGMDLQVGLAVGHHLVTQAGDVHRACDKRFGRGKSRLGNQACRDRSLELVALPVRRLGLEQLAPRDVDSVAVELARAGDSELRTGIDHPAGRVGEIDIADRILE